jgi:hypothetical protein
MVLVFFESFAKENSESRFSSVTSVDRSSFFSFNRNTIIPEEIDPEDADNLDVSDSSIEEERFHPETLEEATVCRSSPIASS